MRGRGAQALGRGDTVCLFPEGASRFHPALAPPKTGGTSLCQITCAVPDARGCSGPPRRGRARAARGRAGLLRLRAPRLGHVHAPDALPLGRARHVPAADSPHRPGPHASASSGCDAPAALTPRQDHPELLRFRDDFAPVRALTADIQRAIAAGTLDAPSWALIRSARLAARMYAPLGTRVRRVRRGVGDG
jgi:glycerol-3-phosphate O-acyltransferase/dihydroxyacetone phosphate acyltransferase